MEESLQLNHMKKLDMKYIWSVFRSALVDSSRSVCGVVKVSGITREECGDMLRRL